MKKGTDRTWEQNPVVEYTTQNQCFAHTKHGFISYLIGAIEMQHFLSPDRHSSMLARTMRYARVAT